MTPECRVLDYRIPSRVHFFILFWSDYKIVCNANIHDLSDLPKIVCKYTWFVCKYLQMSHLAGILDSSIAGFLQAWCHLMYPEGSVNYSGVSVRITIRECVPKLATVKKSEIKYLGFDTRPPFSKLANSGCRIRALQLQLGIWKLSRW